MAVPYTFGAATASIPLSNLDSNFATTITLGNTAIQLGNTVTTLNNMTLANVTVSSGNVTLTNVAVTTANVTTGNVATLVTTSVTNSGLTTGRVVYTSTGGLETSSANLLFDGTTLTVASRGIAKAGMPAGSILQVVQGTFTSQQSTTSTSFTDSNIAASITPTSSASKIVVFIQTTIANTTVGQEVYLTIYRGATNLTASGSGFAAGGATNWLPATVITLDSPATTSATTYTLYFKSSNAAATAYANRGDTQATMILMEVAA
jgi:hypothetical protein